jgi:AGCS family alanine or glycine:cation symporter
MLNFDINIIEKGLVHISEIVWSWPIVAFIVATGCVLTYAFSGIQFTAFFKSWKYLFQKDPSSSNSNSKVDTISPFQAFINALSASLGNGGVAGMATVLVDGGPGTAFWVFLLGFISMILRFTEVYATTTMSNKKDNFTGPFSYIKGLPFGSFFVYVYAVVMLFFIFCAGIAMQTNSMGISLRDMTQLSPSLIGLFFAGIILYIVFGGAKRIMRAAEIIIPVKVLLFFTAIIALLVYHSSRIPEAFQLIIDNAFTIDAAAKGGLAFTMQQAISKGFSRALNATEAGLGTASIFFGATENVNSMRVSIMSMATAFISTNLVCAMVILSIIVSGVQNTGLTSTSLVIAAFKTVFGSYAAPCVTFLSFSFGLGVLVAYSFMGARMWEFIFNKKSLPLYNMLLGLTAFLGTLGTVKLIWSSIDLLVALLIILNLSGLLAIVPQLIKKFKTEKNK